MSRVANHKVGDKVRVISRQKMGSLGRNAPGGIIQGDGMFMYPDKLRFCGDIVTIRNVEESATGYYTIKEGPGNWTDLSFEDTPNLLKDLYA